jgi:hypothetical protein
MDNIIDKLNQIEDKKYDCDEWSLQDKKQLLDLYFIISKKEAHIFDLIYKYHGCDSYEDIFRDYSERYLNDKADGVKIAINEIVEQIERSESQIADNNNL